METTGSSRVYRTAKDLEAQVREEIETQVREELLSDASIRERIVQEVERRMEQWRQQAGKNVIAGPWTEYR